ncbi:MAG: hypothetical protein OEO77_11610 [Acidimicrobiia bacterium]|nr:hypothetical protein [Acidimicrobiia bacterium]
MRRRAVLLSAIIVISSLSIPAAAEPADFGLLTELPFEQLLVGVDMSLPAPPLAAPGVEVIPDPAIDQSVEEWFGCNPPYGGVCVTDPRASDPYVGLVPRTPVSAEDWRPLVEQFFQPGHVDRAVRIIGCESGGDPAAKNSRSTASGLFQHLGSLWGPRADASGYGGADVFDPVANVATAAWLVYEGGGWGHWNASRRCWR